MLFEYKRAGASRQSNAGARQELILTDGRTKAEADAKLREIIKRRGGLIKDWVLDWSA